MKIKITKDYRVYFEQSEPMQVFEKGTSVDLAEPRAKLLIDRGYAEEIKKAVVVENKMVDVSSKAATPKPKKAKK